MQSLQSECASIKLSFIDGYSMLSLFCVHRIQSSFRQTIPPEACRKSLIARVSLPGFMLALRLTATNDSADLFEACDALEPSALLITFLT